MSECNWSGCGHEGKIDGLCAKHHEMRGESLRKLAQADEPSCSKCGKKKSEVKVFIKKKGMCKDCAYPYKNRKTTKKQKPAMVQTIKNTPLEEIKKELKKTLGKQQAKADLINHPPHYTKGKIEVIDFILDQEMGCLDGNIIRYIARYRHKGSAVDDLKKARWYLEKLIAQIEGSV